MQVSADRLNEIIRHIPYTKCADTQDFLCGALSNNWDTHKMSFPSPKDYYNPNWCNVSLNLKSDKHKLVDFIKQTLDKCGYMGIDVELCYGCECECENSFEHCMVLCNTEQGIVIIDSYIRLRTVDIRPLDVDVLLDLLQYPNISPWNLMCKSNHTGKHQSSCEYFMEVEVAFITNT